MKIVKLSEICTFSRGLTYSKSDEVDFSSNVVLRANNIDLDSNSLNLEDLRYIKDSIKIKEEKIAKKNSLIICTASGGKTHVGKVALIDEDYGYAFGGFMGQLTPTDKCHHKFLYYVLTSGLFKDFLMSLNDGTNINNLKFSDIENYEVPLPTLEKQREIVEKLDSAFAEIDALGEVITARIRNTSELFAKICLEKSRDLNPTGFKSLREIATVITKGTTPTSLGHKFTSSGINFLKVESLDENGGFIANKFAYIDSACHENLKRSQLVESDVLVSIAGALGRTAIITADICPANVNQALSLIRLPKDSEILPKFLFALFQAGYFKSELDQMGAGAAQQNLSLTQIGSLKVPIFSEPRQIAFIDFLYNLRGQVTDLKNKLEKQYLLKSELQESILTTSFMNANDELVA
jgi:type I restriction enzyme S subunit